MSQVMISNLGESPARKYGEFIEPGETKSFESDTVETYSLMEISQSLRIIAEKMSRAVSLMECDHEDKLRQVYRQQPFVNHYHGIIPEPEKKTRLQRLLEFLHIKEAKP